MTAKKSPPILPPHGSRPRKANSQPRTLDAMGVEAIADMIVNGMTLSAIAKSLKIDRASLYKWIVASADREKEIARARIAAAQAWDEKAEEVINGARSKIALARSRELAHHYRWRARISDPKAYGEKLEIEQHTTVSDLSDDALAARLEELQRRIAGHNAPPPAADAG